ncbi:hypothetical protein ACU5P1_11500 [Pseudomonas plecoglossicida]|uniref:Uncharacterized protein n=1 Tax=Pseudomonas plecoglossicida TaxID=70775 RepID=A0AAD0VS66_PSEDL|nr:hypothetical protein [Pseudomonas plecoglossicida]AXM94662.1 hypothetical protein DVB73_01875 [Pseudomonas plecoglossicida]EPB96879.1 hypothetical protein L321_05794 [Pseudomonas plecoglossicida NB2011]QLB55399.1 hypothetical protein HAV28_11410 [Pseudomonas plecoglossicida]GLR34940.1 hypothetical protein GCM10011247_03370 [Pseudomonas plecoglossicida]
MTATDRLSLLQYEYLGLDDVAVPEFKIALKELRDLALEDRYEHHAALHLGDIADAENCQQLKEARNWGLGFLQGLACAKGLSQSQIDGLGRVFQLAAERSAARIAG